MSSESILREIHDEEVAIPNEPYHDEPSYSDDDDNNNNSNQHRPRARLQSNNSYESSVISTQSAPPPYELYPPAKTVWGRFFNYVRQIPRFNTHQAIYLPTLPIQQSHSLLRPITTTTTTATATTANGGNDTVPFYWTYYYNVRDRIPKWTLPPLIARYRPLLLCVSFFAIILFSFLLFCSLFFSPAPLPPPVVPDKVAETTARFLTLNIFMRPPLIRNNWSDYKDDRLAYIEKFILPHYDIVTFQESFAFASRRKDRLIIEARRMGFNYHVESPRKYPWDFGIDGGLLLLSRFPILESHTIEYPRGQHADWFSVKGAVHALIELNPKSRVHVYTTHTQASYDLNNNINPDDTAMRLSQFAILRSFIQETSNADQHPVLIAGDLNVDAATHPKQRPITVRSKESSPEYVQMVNILKFQDLRDIVYQHYGHHPVTFGDYMTNDLGELVPAETVLTNWDQLMTVQSIDRIFWAARNTTQIITPIEPQVEKFWVKDNPEMSKEEKKSTGFTQISDHYGLSCTLRLL
ncbi:hypothetical protein RMATCC62417_01341 [Rhizopus microsporus]|nr:hypothetical protein RMATCC62417_01341 [Rhizopus microsporus]